MEVNKKLIVTNGFISKCCMSGCTYPHNSHRLIEECAGNIPVEGGMVSAPYL